MLNTLSAAVCVFLITISAINYLIRFRLVFSSARGLSLIMPCRVVYKSMRVIYKLPQVEAFVGVAALG